MTVGRRLRDARVAAVIAGACALAAGSIVTGYFVVAWVRLDPTQLHKSALEPAKLALLSLTLFLPFLCAGIMITRIFAARSDWIASLYAADLAGAGLGCATIIPLIWTITPPGCVMASGALFALAGLRVAWRHARPVFVALVGLLVVAGAGALRATALPDPVPEPLKFMGRYDPKEQSVVHTRWSPVFRIDVMDSPLDPDVKMIMHDGQFGSALHRFDGDLTRLAAFEGNSRSFPFAVVGRDARVLVIGAAGGHELLTALYFGAAHVTGVELNPATVELLTDRFADFTGHLAENPRVTLVNAEGRSYLKRTGGEYDLIWLVAPDTYAAMNAASSAAYVLSEGYLYTVEMIEEALAHLAPDGILCAQFGEAAFADKPNRTTRYVATAREALRRRGVDEFGRHVVVLTSPDIMTLSTILLKATPFTEAELTRLAAAFPRVAGTQPRWVPGRRADPGPVTNAITLSDDALPRWLAAHSYVVGPVTDDSPFFWHFAWFRDAVHAPDPSIDPEDSTGERVLLVLLAFVVVFAAAMLLLPFAVLGAQWRALPYKGWAAVYFAALGVGFMFFEVPLIQMLTLFLGYPSYSLSVTLFALLLSTGAGSLASARYPRHARTLLVLVGVLALLVACYRFAWPPLVARLIGSGLPIRVLASVAVVAPLGFVLGAFMPLGLGRIAGLATTEREYVAWAWAVNGFFSVISSVASTILAMAIGFNAILLTALAVYAVAVAAMTRIPDAAPTE